MTANDNGAAETPPLFVPKQWVQIQGRSFLIESVAYIKLRPLLQNLPAPRAELKTVQQPKRLWARSGKPYQHLPTSLAKSNSKTLHGKSVRFAEVGSRMTTRRPVVVLDYVFAQGGTDFTFRGDSTYYVTGDATYTGNVIFEAGTVIKYSPYAGLGTSIDIRLTGSVTFLTSAYCPAVFTGQDDNAYGEIISGSTGSPGMGNYGNPYLYINTSMPAYVHDAKFLYAAYGINNYQQTEVRHAQFSNCSRPIYVVNTTLHLRNVLVFQCSQDILSGATVTAENSTFDSLSMINYNWGGSTLTLTNCILSNVTDSSGYTGANNYAWGGTIFQSAGSGYHYLAANSPCRNIGTTNINSQLLADLRTRTTSPPFTLTGISIDTVLGPEVQRDTSLPMDIGYHYAPLDYYVLNGFAITNSASLILTNGVTIGFSGGGITLASANAKIISSGTAGALNRLVWNGMVQELTPYDQAWWALIGFDSNSYSPVQEVRLSYTELSTSWNRYLIYKYLGQGAPLIRLQNCQFRVGRLYAQDSGLLTADVRNCLVASYQSMLEGASASFYNCTFRGGSLSINAAAGQSYTFYDNLFDSINVWNSTSGTWNADYNAYISGLSRLAPVGIHDVIVSSSPAYQSGPLGSFYLPASSPLINSGSRGADAAGLYHHTVLTTQQKETNSIVDIGFHYVALNGSNQPVDTDGDGTPDYLEDANGNGLVDSGETDWNSASDLGLSILITEPKQNSHLP